jgi:hypothetical protein
MSPLPGQPGGANKPQRREPARLRRPLGRTVRRACTPDHGRVARLRGDSSAATELYEHALPELERIRDRRCTASTLKNLATLAFQAGQNRSAVDLCGHQANHGRGGREVLGPAQSNLAVARGIDFDGDFQDLERIMYLLPRLSTPNGLRRGEPSVGDPGPIASQGVVTAGGAGRRPLRRRHRTAPRTRTTSTSTATPATTYHMVLEAGATAT